VAAPVQVRTKGDAFLRYLRKFSEADNLEPAAVGKDRPWPPHEIMQSTQSIDKVGAGPEVKVVGIGKDDLRATRSQFVRRQRLDSAVSPHRHENWRGNRPMFGLNSAGPGLAICFMEVEF